jgi:hypothetical protein
MVHRQLGRREAVLAVVADPCGTLPLPPFRPAQFPGSVLFVLNVSGADI